MPLLESYDRLSISTLYLRMMFSETKQELATATGFIYELENHYYLITNGHNITRLNAMDGARLSQHAGFPDKIVTNCLLWTADKKHLVRSTEDGNVRLYEDEDNTIPCWYMHPEHGYTVDVIAIPIEATSNVPAHIHLNPLNKYEFETRFKPVITDDVFILGYPMNINNPMHMPIWKRATIASEPHYDMDNLPYFLVDTATRSGMSGSPVILQRDGLHIPDGELNAQSFWGTIRSFVGIYSGRFEGTDMYQSQLGIVWKSKVIDEIISGKVKGTIDFQNK